MAPRNPIDKTQSQCHNCQEYGHWARECQRPKRQPTTEERIDYLIRMITRFSKQKEDFMRSSPGSPVIQKVEELIRDKEEELASTELGPRSTPEETPFW